MPAQDASVSNMPIAREGHADTIAGKMDGIVKKAGSVVAGGGHSRKPDTPPQIPDDIDAPVAHNTKRKPDKHSMDYMIRSGVAGGLAGCAVSCITGSMQEDMC